jgi:beta-lactamase regulating signal transducer with metallopeptidase domain
MTSVEMLTGPEAQALGWALVHMFWQAALVAGILAAALKMLPRENAAVRYAISCGALLLVFGLFLATAVRHYDPAAAPVDPLPAETIAAMTAAADSDEKLMLSDVPAVIAATAAAGWRERTFDVLSGARKWLPSVVAVWLAGVLILSSRLLMTWMRARRLARHGATPVAAALQRRAARLASALRLDRAVRILESATVDVPSVVGIFRPVVLIPTSTLTGLTPEQIDMILAHELAHIRRHDFLVNLMQAVAETLLFYHPAVWWISHQIRVERENCCDDMALAVCGNPAQYARALTRLEELRGTASPLLVAATGGSLLERVRRIARRHAVNNVSSRWAAAAVSLTIVIVVAALTSFPALAQREAPPAPAAPPAPVAEIEGIEPIETPKPPKAPKAARPAVGAVDTIPTLPATAPTPTPAPSAVPAVHAAPAATPIPPGTPAPARAPLAVIASIDRGHDFDFDDDDFDEDYDDDEPESESDKRLRAEGKFTVDELIQLRAVGVTPEYIAEMRSLFPGLPINRLASFKALDVTRAFIDEMRSAGFDVSKPGTLESLRASGVTAAYVREMRAAGVKIENASQAASLHNLDVTPQFVKKLGEAGYEDLPVKDLLRLAAVGVDDEFIREMSKYRDKK